MGTVASPEGVTATGVLGVLSKSRLDELARSLDLPLATASQKTAQIASIVAAEPLLEQLLPRLTRDELRAACRAYALDHRGRSRAELMVRLGVQPKPPQPDNDSDALRALGLPSPGKIAVVRHRQYLVTDVQPGGPGEQTLVKLTCLDDDAAGRELEVLWERELGARVIEPEAQGLGTISRLDEPRHFAAYLHALKWNAVTSTDGKLFQAPFRAGIKLLRHQLVPLMKALALPRANLFIADDVGLGKTIEAGLVMQELLLRQRVDQILIVAPASVCLQWQAEMEKRFGLRFEIYNRAFVGRRRQERGFGVNAWATYPRFIISFQTLRRPEYRDLLLAHLREQAQVGDRARKSLLVVDEAHNAAPSSATKYAVDSDTTNVIRDVAQVFEHRLFLSATPHNGHSNSFSALLEILDPQRFTRGVPVKNRSVLDEVMVRRLKRDIKALEHSDDYPDRHVVQVNLVAASTSDPKAAWTAQYAETDQVLGRHDLGAAGTADLQLSDLLRQYAAVANVKGKRGRLALVNLQKRLLSSIEAFARTLGKHARSVAPDLVADAPTDDDDEAAALSEEYGSADDSELEDDRADHHAVVAAGAARDLLTRMLRLAHQHRDAPSPKVLALLDWIRRHQCPGAALGGLSRTAPKADRRWTDTRLIVFTEYAHTKAYLRHLLAAAIDGSDVADARIMDFHGGMSDEQRAEVQRAFNGPPGQYPVRILLCTDAAREGVNLQGHCANLFHFDVPWNPGRLEQRNGRIDRTLQPFRDVHCHYFVYPQRVEDRVLAVLIKKVDRIQRELGSLGTVIAEQLADALEDGIDESSLARLDSAESLGGAIEEFVQTAGDELAGFAETARHQADVEASSEILNRSRAVAGFSVEHLRDAIDVGLELSGAARLETDEDGRFTLPEMPTGWERTLDTLRPARRLDQDFWEWRDQPPLPVVFQPPDRMTSDVVHLHLHHPFVQRILSRFLAQGFAANDLSRVTVVSNDQDALTRVIAFGRLTLFGQGASRLHEELIGVSARWSESGGGLRPFAEEADRKALEQLESLLERSPRLAVSQAAQRTLCKAAPGDFAALWPHVDAESDARQQLAEQRLTARGAREAEQMRQILERQRDAIHQRMNSKTQLDLFAPDDSVFDRRQRKQLEDDLRYMQRRYDEMSIDLEREPARIQDGYRVVRARLEPVGLVYLWPASR
jgi:hypothetical protein